MVKSIDFSHGVRGMFANRDIVVVGDANARCKQGNTTRTRKAVRRRNPPKLVVEIDADLLPYFKTAEAVNEALRAVVQATHNR